MALQRKKERISQPTEAEIRLAAMNLLAYREHGFDELVNKLLSQFEGREMVEIQVQILADEKLQCDRRFAESYVRSKVAKPLGPMRIKQELRQKGVNLHDIELAFAELEVDWLVLLRRLSERKYGVEQPVDTKERAKRYRFFLYRGFSSEQVREVMSG